MKKNVEKFGISDKRGREQTNLDPFVPGKGLKDPSLCKHCHNYFHDNRWSNDTQAYEQLKERTDVHWVVCPSCRKAREGVVEGVLTLRGSYLWKHENEIRRLLENEKDKMTARNPLERIVRMEREEDQLIVETTEKRLVEQLGRALQRAHRGEFDIQWSGCPEVCRVSWERTL